VNVPKSEKDLGLEVYSTKTDGIGGRLRQFPEDFRVEEVLTDGSKATVEPIIEEHVIGNGRYLICTLVKRNLDAILAVQMIARKLKIDVERIGIAGLKDTRALTTQHVSIARMVPEQALTLKLRDLQLYPMRFSSEKIHSNLLLGNQFYIKSRAVRHGPREILKRTVETHNELSKLGGCPNFYGHQRFGTSRPITHLVGKWLISDQWEKAALTFLARASPNEYPESRQARQQLFDTQDYEYALRNFPFTLVYERQMLGHLARRHGDFRGAFYRLPKKLCQLFVQAQQSYLFNKFLSERIRHELPLKIASKNEFKVKVDDEEYLALPLVGYRQHLSSGEEGEIEKQILEREEITPQSFKIPDMPQISSPGKLRSALTPLIEFHADKPLVDSANADKKTVSFDFALRKGSYATIILREFMKPRNPVRSGF
jgi:tRNA pseudouridine13 synthase